MCEEKKEGKQVGVSEGFFFPNRKDYYKKKKTFIAKCLNWEVGGGLCHRVCDYLPAKPHSLH